MQLLHIYWEKNVAVLEMTRNVVGKICNVLVKICSVVVNSDSGCRFYSSASRRRG